MRPLEPRDARERTLARLLDALWDRYRARMPYARRFEELFPGFHNDHVAFRTIAWQDPPAGIFSISRLFEALGYAASACYEFPDKSLSAIHYQHPNPEFPKLFISQLKSWELSAKSQAIIARSMRRHRPPFSLPAALSYFTKLPWPLPRKEDVLALDKESQYGAWVLLNGYDVNHFTGAVEDIEKAVAAMRAAGVPMKAEIEGARGSRLRQSSTEAVRTDAAVSSGSRITTMPWTYAYFELAERPLLRNPATGLRERFEGFLGGQAAQLFEMTKVKPVV